jgi:hypothetical protein
MEAEEAAALRKQLADAHAANAALQAARAAERAAAEETLAAVEAARAAERAAAKEALAVVEAARAEAVAQAAAAEKRGARDAAFASLAQFALVLRSSQWQTTDCCAEAAQGSAFSRVVAAKAAALPARPACWRCARHKATA